jgi:hypothetical protein
LDESFSLKGKVIGKNNCPFSNHKVIAYDRDSFLSPDDFLGDSIIDEKGFFQIEFDTAKFVDVLEIIEGSPDIFLVLKDEENKEIFQTRVTKTKKEIEYHIKVSKTIPDPDAPDIYSGNTKRMINILNNLVNIIDFEYNSNKDALNRIDISDKSKENSQHFIDNYDQIIDNFNSILVISKGLINNYMKEMNLSIIQYDAPQVPRFPQKKNYNQVIIWPRREKFKWE